MAKYVKNGKLVPLGNGFSLVQGQHPNKVDDVDIGPNNSNGLSVNHGEIIQNRGKDIRVFSAEPMFNGVSPASLLYGGANPNKVFAMQEQWKKTHRVKDDGTRYQNGGDKYKTKLTDGEEKAFQRWYAKYADATGNSVNPDDKKHYYDYRGYWKEFETNPLKWHTDLNDKEIHLSDKYKTPGHETFSDESIYADDEHPGGHWVGKDFHSRKEYNNRLSYLKNLDEFIKKNPIVAGINTSDFRDFMADIARFESNYNMKAVGKKSNGGRSGYNGYYGLKVKENVSSDKQHIKAFEHLADLLKYNITKEDIDLASSKQISQSQLLAKYWNQGNRTTNWIYNNIDSKDGAGTKISEYGNNANSNVNIRDSVKNAITSDTYIIKPNETIADISMLVRRPNRQYVAGSDDIVGAQGPNFNVKKYHVGDTLKLNFDNFDYTKYNNGVDLLSSKNKQFGGTMSKRKKAKLGAQSPDNILDTYAFLNALQEEAGGNRMYGHAEPFIGHDGKVHTGGVVTFSDDANPSLINGRIEPSVVTAKSKVGYKPSITLGTNPSASDLNIHYTPVNDPVVSSTDTPLPKVDLNPSIQEKALGIHQTVQRPTPDASTTPSGSGLSKMDLIGLGVGAVNNVIGLASNLITSKYQKPIVKQAPVLHSTRLVDRVRPYVDSIREQAAKMAYLNDRTAASSRTRFARVQDINANKNLQETAEVNRADQASVALQNNSLLNQQNIRNQNAINATNVENENAAARTLLHNQKVQDINDSIAQFVNNGNDLINGERGILARKDARESELRNLATMFAANPYALEAFKKGNYQKALELLKQTRV